MTAYDCAAETSRISPRPVVVTRVTNAIVNFTRAFRNRRAFYQLDEMSDAELADIGLVRADLAVADSRSIRNDPTEFLRDIVAERAEKIEEMARR